jgi:sigma-B regulation protein RsbU (phosphoserine phosphatase)
MNVRKMAGSRSRRNPQGELTYESRFEHSALFEFSKIINSSLSQNFIMGHILLTIMGKMLATKGMVLLARSDHQFEIAAVKGFPARMIGQGVTIPRVPTTMFSLDRLKRARSPWVDFFLLNGVEFLLPMFINEKTIGFLGFGGRLSRRKLSTTEETYLRSLANISASAIEKTRTLEEIRQINRKLDIKVQELKTLFELGKEFSSLLDWEKQTRLLVFSILGQIGVQRYLVCLRQGNDMRVVASRIDSPEPQPKLLESLASIKKPVLVENLTVRGIADIREILGTIGIKVVIPMQFQGETRGFILLGEKLSREGFTLADLEFLASLGSLAMISLENVRLFKEAIEKQRLEDELMIAREIQKGLLPAALPTIPGVSVAAMNVSSKQVGGDYYDILPISKSRWLLAIGDVSGKGTPAALLMANLQATIRALVSLNIPLEELTARVNDLMCDNTGGSRFVTFFWGILDAEKRVLRYVNAGHNYPFVVSEDGSVRRLDKGGMILGVLKSVSYEEGSLQLKAGDVLVLFTDGVTEAMDKNSREYGEDRLEALLRRISSDDADRIMHRTHDDIKTYAAGEPQSDDITMMVLKVY